MDLPFQEGELGPSPKDAGGWAAEFHSQVKVVEEAAREFAVRWHEPGDGSWPPCSG